MQKLDVLIIGAGILGLATALKLLQKHPGLSLVIIDKEDTIAAHQTGHNSGVIHSGIYYKPGSLKAQNCKRGVGLLLEYCMQKAIPIDICGKLIVATTPEELPRLEELERRGLANGVPRLKKLEKNGIKAIEPHVEGLAALYSPTTSIIDFTLVAKAYAEDIRKAGGLIRLNERVLRLTNNWVVETTKGSYQAKQVINCAGFHADRVAHLGDKTVAPKQIIPFRGEYYELKKERRNLVNGLIYPVPDPQFPFLGVHLSKTIDGRVEAGPNAVLALAREGYKKTDVSLKDCYDLLTYPGFWAMVKKYWRVGAYEFYRSFSKQAFLKSLQKLIPTLTLEDLIPAESGVRSQIVLPDGKLQDDFLIIEKPGLLNILNAPSPAATASLAIGEAIAAKVKI